MVVTCAGSNEGRPWPSSSNAKKHLDIAALSKVVRLTCAVTASPGVDEGATTTLRNSKHFQGWPLACPLESIAVQHAAVVDCSAQALCEMLGAADADTKELYDRGGG